MRRILLPMLAISMCLFACKKDNTSNTAPIPENEQRYPLNLSLSGFIQQSEMLKNARQDSALGGITDIYYLAVSQSGGSFAGFKHQHTDADSADFGNIRDTLYAGNYVVYLLASDTSLDLSYGNSPLDNRINAYLSGSNTLIPFKDLFYKKLSITVGAGSSQTQDVILSRVVGNLRVEVLDATVNPDYEVSVKVTGENAQTYIADLTMVNPGTYPLYMPRISPTVFSNNIINTTGKETVTITARNTHTGEQIQKVVGDVFCYKNKRTTLSGSLGIPGTPAGITKGFEVKVNDNWDPNDNNIGF